MTINEIEKLKLENIQLKRERLQLEMERLKAQAEVVKEQIEARLGISLDSHKIDFATGEIEEIQQ